MTAPHVSPRELSRPDFPAVVHTYTDLLRVLSTSDDRTATPKHLAQATDRDGSNIRRDAQKLRDAGVIAIRADGAWTLTDKGERWVIGQDVAAGAAQVGQASSNAPRWPADKIRRNPINRVVTTASVEGMADAIEGAEDILIPVRLTPADANGVRMLLAGERRWEGAKLCERRGSLPEALKAGIPFTEGEVSADDGALIAVIENTARKDLSPWEDAQLLKAAADGLGITNASELARRIGRAREGDRGGVRDVQTKLRVATLATPAAIAAYEINGSWDELRDSCKDPDKIVTTRAQRLALAEIWHKAGRTQADVAMLPAGHSAEGARLAQYGLAILTRTDKGDLARVTQAGADYLKAERLDGAIEHARQSLGYPEGYGVAALRTEWLNTPSDNDPWRTRGTQHVSTKSAPASACVEGVREASFALYQEKADRVGQEHRYRACLSVEMDNRVLHANKPIPGPATPGLAYQMAIEDFLKWEWPEAPQALIEWADRIAGPFVVAGRDHHNASRAQEARYALGWDKRQSNSGGGSSSQSKAKDETDAAPAIEPAATSTADRLMAADFGVPTDWKADNRQDAASWMDGFSHERVVFDAQGVQATIEVALIKNSSGWVNGSRVSTATSGHSSTLSGVWAAHTPAFHTQADAAREAAERIAQTVGARMTPKLRKWLDDAPSLFAKVDRETDDEHFSAPPGAVPPASVMRAHLGDLAQARANATDGVLRLIADERRRQIEVERFTPAQDDEQNEDGEMALAAAAYAAASAGDPDAALFWPGGWDPKMFKPSQDNRDLIRAGALIVAELERRVRVSAGMVGDA